MSDRGMKKWLAYKSLIEQAPSLENILTKRERVEKPIVSQDMKEKINDILTNYQGETLVVTFFRDNKIIQDEIIVKKIDMVERKLVLNSRRVIHFGEIVNLLIK